MCILTRTAYCNRWRDDGAFLLRKNAGLMQNPARQTRKILTTQSLSAACDLYPPQGQNWEKTAKRTRCGAAHEQRRDTILQNKGFRALDSKNPAFLVCKPIHLWYDADT